jgi:magnesium chelatase accessory protein
MTWHVQLLGSGPLLLLLHGTAAATHSWRDLAPLLARHFTVLGLDLPGHGFTTLDRHHALSLPFMATAVTRLLKVLELTPVVVVGHSAGAAIGLRMALDGAIAPERMISLNGALRPFTGVESWLYPAIAKLLFVNPLAASLLAWRAGDSNAVRRLIEGTGSVIDDQELDFYVRLLRTLRHVEAALSMMANWDLRPFRRELPRLRMPVTLIAALGDLAVPLQVAQDAASLLPVARLVEVAGLGHLAHEEDAGAISDVILQQFATLGGCKPD